MDFVEPGGRLALRLDFDDAVVDDKDTYRIYMWGVCTQPWLENERLDVQVRKSDEITLTHTTNDALPCSAVAPKPPTMLPEIEYNPLSLPPFEPTQLRGIGYKRWCAEPSCAWLGWIVLVPSALCLLHTVMTIRLQVRRRRGLE